MAQLLKNLVGHNYMYYFGVTFLTGFKKKKKTISTYIILLRRCKNGHYHLSLLKEDITSNLTKSNVIFPFDFLYAACMLNKTNGKLLMNMTYVYLDLYELPLNRKGFVFNNLKNDVKVFYHKHSYTTIKEIWSNSGRVLLGIFSYGNKYNTISRVTTVQSISREAILQVTLYHTLQYISFRKSKWINSKTEKYD